MSSDSKVPLVAVITGASSGIGEAVAQMIGRDPNARLVLVARREEKLRELADSVGCPATWVAADVTDDDAPQRVLDHVTAEHGRLTFLLNNAGAAWRAPFAEGGYANVKRTMDLNFDAVVRMTEALLPLLRESAPSSIVNISSTAGRVARPGTGSYSASKFALAGWTDSLHHEEKPERRARRPRAARLHQDRGLPRRRAARAGWCRRPRRRPRPSSRPGPAGRPSATCRAATGSRPRCASSPRR